jgi:hypothetical protein
VNTITNSARMLAVLIVSSLLPWAAVFGDEQPTRDPVTVHAGDFSARTLGEAVVDGRPVIVMEAVAKNRRIAQAAGYARIKAWVDAERMTYRKIVFWDADGQAVTTVEILSMETPGRAERFQVTDHATGRTTVFEAPRRSDADGTVVHSFPFEF